MILVFETPILLDRAMGFSEYITKPLRQLRNLRGTL